MCIFYFSKKIASWVIISDTDAAVLPRFLPSRVVAAVTTVAFLAPGVALLQVSDGAFVPPTPGLAPNRTVELQADQVAAGREEGTLSAPPGF